MQKQTNDAVGEAVKIKNDLEESKVVYDNTNYTQLANDFVKFEVPEVMKDMFNKVGKTSFGSLGFTKMVFFQHERSFGNDTFDQFAGLSPARYEEEDYNDYRNRRLLGKALLKYRTLLYAYPVTSESEKELKRFKKAKKSL